MRMRIEEYKRRKKEERGGGVDWIFRGMKKLFISLFKFKQKDKQN